MVGTYCPRLLSQVGSLASAVQSYFQPRTVQKTQEAKGEMILKGYAKGCKKGVKKVKLTVLWLSLFS